MGCSHADRSFRSPRLIAVLLGQLALTSVPAAAADPRPADRRLTVVTYNIHHGAGVDGVVDLERIAEVLISATADVIALQEVDRHWSSRSGWVDQPVWFAERLDKHMVYGANLDLDPLEPGQPRRQ
jgi:endonuclease/exonuclease/phosphatase family metal-dependent hydrolase